MAKLELGRKDFRVDATSLCSGLCDNDYHELPIRGAHALAARHLPLVHSDVFDRLLIAQASIERVTLLTMDETMDCYPNPIQKVQACA